MNTNYTPETFQSQEHPSALKQSGLGIASFVLSLVCLIGYIGTIIGAVGLIVNIAGDLQSMSSLESSSHLGVLVTVGFLILVFFLVNLVGLILGIVGLAMKHRKKGFSIAGTTINAVLMFGIISLYLIGIANH